ncbi:hypothetical protein F7725_007006 [Dissostichus mawsoni]|uniref:IRF tryptophan pentad repeat domain-containing protein n=1 Tax=Dissostichus mawsoni TaxID=36200 RepID=A0A7J5XVJ7_DISMA|nr:hypothetical protein F7725_007006 [Dissostichus mawsoni]
MAGEPDRVKYRLGSQLGGQGFENVLNSLETCGPTRLGDKDACLFKKWALHTGKYIEGQACDPKTWKANFRCAMNSLPDIEEVKDKSINKGHQAVRVFRMLPVCPKSRDKRSKAKQTKSRTKNAIKMEEDSDSSDTQSQCPIEPSIQREPSSTQENKVDSTVQNEQTDFSFLNPSDVPDWSVSLEIDSSFPNSFYHRFEVSPEHSSICQQLEQESSWPTFPSDNIGFLSNEACTSPGSQWSESSSADELDEIPSYTHWAQTTQIAQTTSGPTSCKRIEIFRMG